MQEKKNFYDLDELKAIPIEDICELYGIPVYRHNNSLWFSIRNEKTPSAKIYQDTNTFCDFGNKQLSGDNIKLVAIIENLSNTKAIEHLADLFGIKPINTYDFKQGYDLTARQYAKINIQSDVALKNLDGIISMSLQDKELKNSYESLDISMQALRKTAPELYHLILKEKALPYLKGLKNNYYESCFINDRLCKKLNADIFSVESIMEELEGYKVLLEQTEQIFLQAIDDKNMFKMRKYDVKKDILEIRSGKINFEFGKVSYDELKKSGQDLAYLAVNIEDYFKNRDMFNQKHAAFYNRGKPKVICLKSDLQEIESIFQIPQKQTKEK